MVLSTACLALFALLLLCFIPCCCHPQEAHEDDVSARKHPFLFKASDILASALKTSDVALLRGLLLRVKYNSYPISNPGSGSTLATGIFPSASYFNHSCAPCVHYSCSVSSEGEWRIFFRSSRPIAVGEDATIAYVDGYQVKEERTRLLRAGYRFDCK